MINFIEVENFRCFRELRLTGLKQFNVVVGDSGSGKTALLEAIFLLSGASPEVWMRLRQWRGSGSLIRLTGTRASYESLFRDIFFDFDKSRGANFRLVGDRGVARSLKIHYPNQERLALHVKADASAPAENAFLIDPIVFHWKTKGKEMKAKVETKEGVIKYSGFNTVYPAWYSSPVVNDAAMIAPMFSELSLKKKAASLIRAVSALFPYVEDVTLESIAGEPTLCVSMESVSEKVPIGNISSGLNKFLSIMTAIAANEGGVLLIDEFEVGFYYSTLPKLLESIIAFCEEHRTQIFATTHSYEFLQALLPIMKAREDTEHAFALLRSQKQKKEATLRVLQNPAAAIASNFEVR